MALADFVTRMLEAYQKDIADQFTKFNATLQVNTQQRNNLTALLHEFSHCLSVVVKSPFASSLFSQRDIPSQWSWVDPSLITDIANGNN